MYWRGQATHAKIDSNNVNCYVRKSEFESMCIYTLCVCVCMFAEMWICMHMNVYACAIGYACVNVYVYDYEPV